MRLWRIFEPARTVLISILFCLLSAERLAGAWPTYRFDNAHSGASPNSLKTPLELQWTYLPRHAPRPAWPEPCKEAHRLAFDYAPQVAIAHGLVVFGSSSDHQVRALELATGRERWHFFTEAPVRFAPCVAGDRLFVTSDDGCLYCLAVQNGELLWRFRGGPRDERLMGNEQMISRWPGRAGVLVEGESVFFAAGMWQTDGIYIYALRAQDGKMFWKNDTSNSIYMKLPHSSMEGIASVAPQGQMALCGDTLLVPCGRAMPAGFDKNTGKLLFCDNGSDKLHHAGGSWVMAAQGLFFCRRRPVQGHPHVDLKEAELPAGSGLLAWDGETGKQVLALIGKHRAAVHGDVLFAAGDGELLSIDLSALLQRGQTYYGSGEIDPDLPQKNGRPSSYLSMYWKGAGAPWGPWKVVPVSTGSSERWKTKLERAYELILAGETIVAGGRGWVRILDARDGADLWEKTISGDARGLAASDGRLIVSSTTGEIHCFGERTPEQTKEILPPEAVVTDAGWASAEAERILSEVGTPSGICLVIGAGDGRLVQALVQQSDWSVVCAETNENTASAAREYLDRAGVYGTRAVVHSVPSDPLPYARYFANAIVLHETHIGDGAPVAAEELYRVLRPCGGVLWVSVSKTKPERVRQWLEAGGMSSDRMNVSAERVRFVRGDLPGAAEWTHPYGGASRPGASTDSHVRLPLKMLWFGKPGPARTISRHWRTPSPLFINGRMFVAGEHHLIGIDAYNGREIWCREIPGVGRFPGRYRGGGPVADNDAIYVAVGMECLRLDASTGETLATYGVPESLRDVPVLENPIVSALDAGRRKATPTPNEAVWEFLAVTEDFIVGSVGQPNFAWTGWPEAHPECPCVFVLDKKDGSLLWVYEAEESVSPNGVCLQGDSLFLLDQKSRASLEREGRRNQKTKDRQPLLKAFDLRTGEDLWKTSEGLSGIYLWMGEGIVLVTKGGTSAYSAKDGELLWSRRISGHPYPVIVGDTLYLYPGAYDLHTGADRERVHPLTNRLSRWTMASKGGCGSLSGCPGALFFRAGASGICDLRGDAGTGWLGQVRASCWVNMIAAGGMLLFPEGASSCSCPYNYQTSLAMVPDEREEQWTVFPASYVPPGSRLRTLAVNFGAPGDKRDGGGELWTAFPRPFKPDALTVPLFLMNRPTYARKNADSVSMKGDGAPWLYGSVCKGLERAELELFLNEPVYATICDDPPAIDGVLDDLCWHDTTRLVLTTDDQDTDRHAVAFLRSDESNLYVGFSRDAYFRNGAPVPWVATTSGEDAKPWNDDSFGIRLWDSNARTGLYLHISNTGATFDGRTDSTMYGLIGSDSSWNGNWSRSVSTESERWSAELAVPWHTLEEAGLRKDALSVYLESINRTDAGPSRVQYKYRTLRRLYLFKRLVPVLFSDPPQRPPSDYAVTLHFAEMEDMDTGDRVFDVRIQGETVIADLDVVKEAGGLNTPLFKTVSQVEAADRLILELVPKTEEPPIISGLEVRYDEEKGLERTVSSVKESLVAHWDFDDEEKSVARNRVDGGDGARIVGASRIPGASGGGLQFYGVDDVVCCGTDDALNAGKELTVSAWIWISSYHADLYHDVILSKGVGAYSIYLHRKNGGDLHGYVTLGGKPQALPIHSPEFGEWHHIAMTVRDGEQRTYYDGVLQGTWTYRGAIGTTPSELRLGFSEDFPIAGHFCGKIDDVRVWNSVLSPEAIQWIAFEASS